MQRALPVLLLVTPLLALDRDGYLTDAAKDFWWLLAHIAKQSGNE